MSILHLRNMINRNIMQYVFLIALMGMFCIKLSAENPTPGTTLVKGKQMASLKVGMENRKTGEPVLVFESGLGSGGGSFMPLLVSLPAGIPGFAYDRNGLGQSEIDTALVSDADVVHRLHDLLVESRVEPPYILVGHSLGGPLVRLFASYYPDEVGGLMFIDPTNYMLTREEDEQVKINTNSRTGYRELLPIMFSEMLADNALPRGVRQEISRVKRAGEPVYFAEYQSLAPLQNIPCIVLIAYNRRTEQAELELSKKTGINLEPWFAELDMIRVKHYAQLIKNNDNSSVVMLPRYSHGIHHQDPRLVTNYIEWLYKTVSSKRRQ